MSAPPRAVALELDTVLADTRPLWRAWLEDAARRFRSIASLEPDRLPDDRGAAAAELDRWAAEGVGDWHRALERFAEDNAPVHLRPDPAANAALRALRAAGHEIRVVTDAPEPLARVALRHLGVARHVDDLVERAEPGETVVATRDELVEASGRRG